MVSHLVCYFTLTSTRMKGIPMTNEKPSHSRFSAALASLLFLTAAACGLSEDSSVAPKKDASADAKGGGAGTSAAGGGAGSATAGNFGGGGGSGGAGKAGPARAGDPRTPDSTPRRPPRP